nr:MAG TPA: hypothetical protein [Caudoviricetes sp.]
MCPVGSRTRDSNPSAQGRGLTTSKSLVFPANSVYLLFTVSLIRHTFAGVD